MLSELDARRTDHSPVSGRTVPLIGRCPERVHTRTSCCVLRLPYFATSAVALPYSRAPTPCHPTQWRARAVPVAVQHLNVAGRLSAPRRPFTSRVGQRAATFGRGSSLWPPRTRVGLDRRYHPSSGPPCLVGSGLFAGLVW